VKCALDQIRISC